MCKHECKHAVTRQEKKPRSYKVFYDAEEQSLIDSPYDVIDSEEKLVELIKEIGEREGYAFDVDLLGIYEKIDVIINIKRTIDISLKLA